MSGRGKKAPAGQGQGQGQQQQQQDTSSLFVELARLQQSQDFDKALKVCNRILNAAPKDAKAFHCKIVCLVQVDKFQAALDQINEQAHSLPGLDLSFEHAYCLYRLNQPLEALEILEQAKKTDSTKINELKAQVLYRLERFEDAFNMYRTILKNSSDDFEVERLTNLAAAGVYCGQDVQDVDDETYEMLYNRACKLLADENWPEAESVLREALKACQEFYKEEGESDEDIENETGILRVQIGFCLQMQGGIAKEKEAQGLYNSVLRAKPDDIGLVAVASNNLVTLNREANIFDSKKRIKAATTEGLEHKLTIKHRFAIARNNALLAMYTNQVDLCKSLIQELGAKFGIITEDKDMITAGVLARAGRTQEAVDILLKSQSDDLLRVLTAAQVYLEKGDINSAISLFEKLPNKEKFRTGILSAMVTLYLAMDRRESAAKLLKNAVLEGQKQKKDRKDKDMAIVWRKTAEFHLKGNQPTVAAQSLEELLRNNPSDKQTLAQLVLAYAKFDLKRALEASKKLPDLSASAGAVDVDALESTAFLGANKIAKRTPKPGGVASPKVKTPGTEGDVLLKKKTRRKKKKKRLPKNYNPDVDPDPERWIPRKERTGYRKPRKDRRKGEKFTGAQGTAAGQSETFDYSSKKATNPAAGGAIPKGAKSPEAPVGPRQAQWKPQQKKKGKNKKR